MLKSIIQIKVLKSVVITNDITADDKKVKEMMMINNIMKMTD